MSEVRDEVSKRRVSKVIGDVRQEVREVVGTRDG